MSPRALGTAVLVLVTVIWGSTFPIMKVVIAELNLHLMILVRFGVAGIVLLLWRRPASAALKAGLVLGLLGYLGILAQVQGLLTVDAGRAAFITGLSVVMVPFLATLYLRTRVRPLAIAGAGLAATGLGVLAFDGGPPGPGDLWVLLCACIYALYIVGLERALRFATPLDLAVVQAVTMGVLAAIPAMGQLERLGALSTVQWGWLLYLALAATALVLILQGVGQRHVDATTAAIVYTLEPVFATLFAFLMLGEVFGVRGWLGAITIGTAMLLAQLPAAQPGAGRQPSPAHAPATPPGD
jgi:drug/metabolite transporter (DMT)-like permease